MAVRAGGPAETLPTSRVAGWLRGCGVDVASPVTARLVPGGRSNLTYVLTDGRGRRVVLRRPPLGGVLDTAHDMSREWRFITALRPTSVPVPEPLSCDPDGELLGVPFFVMSFVDGLVLHDADAAVSLPLEAREEAAASLIDVMAALHAVDIDAVGLGGVAPRDGYVGRQLRRWKRQWDQSVTTDIAAVATAHDRLSRANPPAGASTVVHGDFRLGNMICDRTGQIQSVLDWELATLGDPLADLGWLLSYWTEPDEWTGIHTDPAPPSVLDGFPSRQWMVDRYQAQTGADLSALEFYLAFAHWRSACISAGVLTRYQAGAMADDGFDPQGLRRSVSERAEAALALLDSGVT